MLEYKEAFRIELHNSRTLIYQARCAGMGIFNDMPGIALRTEITTLLRCLGISTSKSERDELDRWFLTMDYEDLKIADGDTLEAAIDNNGSLHIKIHYLTSDHPSVSEFTYCGSYTIEWAEQDVSEANN